VSRGRVTAKLQKPSKGPKDANLHVRVSTETLQVWQATADRENRSLSNWVETVLNGYIAESAKAK
jgi:predicted HicB family RNase H-like nuclease